MHVFTGLVIVFLSVIIVLFNKIIFNKLSNHNILFKFIEFIIYYKVFFYLLLPAILRLISGFQYEHEDDIEQLELLAIYLIESTSYFIWIGVFYIMVNKFKGIRDSRKTTQFW